MFGNQFNKQQWNSFLEEKAIELKLTKAQSRVFITRFKHDNWHKKIEDVWSESEVNSSEAFVAHSTKVYQKLRPGCPEIGQGAGNFLIAREYLLNQAFLPLRINSSREFFETERQECYREIDQSGALIRIKAPRKMGKSRLLNSILNHANKQQYDTVHINLLQIECSKLEGIDSFLRWFCAYLSHALNLHLKLDSYWNADLSSMLSCTRYLEAILEQCEQPLVLGLDEVDRLLSYPNISQDFFYLLRSWHEEANNDELWEKLRLVVVYSTEDFGSLDINQSPFNVGLPIELKPIERSQLAQLATSYGLNLSSTQIERLMVMLGGHPYLVDLILSSLSGNSQLSLDELLQQAATDRGIYSSYLRQHLINLKSNSKLAEIFLQILNSPEPLQVDALLGYQLYRMGLIKWSQNNSVIPSCELFKLYFLPRLQATQ